MSWNATHHADSANQKGTGQSHSAHNHTVDHHDHMGYLSSMSHASNPSKNSHLQPSASANSSTKDTLLVFLTLAFISVTLYFTFFLWKKHREKPLATLYKLEEYRYSRLSQNEMEVDNVVFYGDAFQADASHNSDEDEDCKPATLEMETDSLISLSNCKSVSSMATSINVTSNNASEVQQALLTSSDQAPSVQSMTAGGNLLQDSDEDLLQ